MGREIIAMKTIKENKINQSPAQVNSNNELKSRITMLKNLRGEMEWK